jgi:hypothetical protein
MPKTTKNKGPRARSLKHLGYNQVWFNVRVRRNRRRDAIARQSRRINRRR